MQRRMPAIGGCSPHHSWKTSIFIIGLVSLLVALASCGDPPDKTPSSTTASIGIPRNQFAEIYRSVADQRVWQTWINGDYVFWMEAPAPGNTAELGYSQAQQYGTRLKYMRLDSATVTEVPGSAIEPPAESNLQLPVSRAAVLPAASGQEPRVVWTTPPQHLAGGSAYHGLQRWSPRTKTETVLPDSTRLLSPIASGDVLAVPVVAEGAEGTTTTGDAAAKPRMLMMTSNTKEPIPVDPAAPQLPAWALSGLSPYFALGTSDYGERTKPVIFDLRNGKSLDIPVPGWEAPTIASHWAAWCTTTPSSETTIRYSVFLADLDTLTVHQVATGTELFWVSPAVALSPDWLITLDRGADNETAPNSEDLLAFHLPDMGEVRVASVLGADETGGLQLSGDRVLMTVWKGLSDIPHDQADWTALRVTELSR